MDMQSRYDSTSTKENTTNTVPCQNHKQAPHIDQTFQMAKYYASFTTMPHSCSSLPYMMFTSHDLIRRA